MKQIQESICVLVLSCIFILQGFAQDDYEWGSLPLGGGGFVSAVIAHPTEKNLIYARTDVGGIYRWIESTSSWKPLTDFISAADKGLYGIESIALDPQKPEMLYALAGTSYFSDGKTAILISNDYGETYSVVEVTSLFTAHGNGDGRSAGEKMAVDPHNSNIIFCGSRSAGLFKSTNAGQSWSKVSSFPVSSTSNGNGISFVLFDENSTVSGSATQTIYVGVSQSSGIYVSKDGGSSWTQIASQPSTGVAHRAAMKNSTIYITYAGGAAPNISGNNGAVYKYNGSSWTNITPESSFNYGGISIVGNRILVSSTNMWYKQNNWSCYGDEIFISENLGSSWTSKMFTNSKVTLNANGNTWITDHALHWTGCATLDPNNANRAFFTSGNGIFYTTNLSTSGFTLKFCYAGLEETVPLDIAQIPSGGLISVIGDYDGATYTANSDGDYVTYPDVHTPEMGTTSGVAISGNGSLAVRAGNTSPYVQYSTDKGSSWTYCSSSKGAKGNVAVTYDGSTILHCPDGSSTTYYSTNKGSSWSSCNGLSISDAYPVADGSNAKKIYVAGGNNLYVSTDGGKNFSSSGSLASTYNWTTYKKIRTVPGVEGDIWAPCGGNGLYHSTNSGSSFSKISNVSSCLAVGLGKAATGKTYPSIYIWGTVSGTEGLYRSDDQGSSWTRINDDLHQFGGPGNGMYVVGDFGVYGNVAMGTVGRGAIYGKLATAQCAKVDLGDDIDICGVESPILNSGTKTNTNVTYTWYKDDVVISGATSPTLAITSGGTYKVVRDSATCSKSDEITVSAILPVVDLGEDKNLCETTSMTFDAGISADGYSYQWKKNAVDIDGATSKAYIATEPATYSCVVSAANCADVSDEVVLTSSLLNVDVTSACKDGGEANLKVTDEGGPYEWYSTQTGGSVLETGVSYSPIISKNTTYYVQDAGGTSYTVGNFEVNTSDGWNTDDFTGSTSKLNVVVTTACTLESIWVYLLYEYETPTITISLLDASTNEVKYTKTSGNLSSGSLQEVPLNFALVPGSYILSFEGSSNGMFLQTSGASYPYGYEGYISVSNYESWATAYVSCCYKMKIKIGSTCARTPVTATIDSDLLCADTESPILSSEISVTNLVQNAVSLSWSAATDNVGVAGYEVYVNEEKSTISTNSIDLTDLTCKTDYEIKVRAYDEAGNYSEYISKSITTPETDKPTATTNYEYKVGDVAAVLTAEGTNLQWYDSEMNTLASAPVPATTAIANLTYYVTQTINTCESDVVEITVSIVTNTVEQTISLSKGWNLISLYVTPSVTAISSILSGVDFDIIKNNDGFYHNGTATELQSISEMIPGEGYLVYVNTATSLSIEGVPLKGYTSNLKTGWNVIGVPQNVTKSVSALPAIITEIKDLSDSAVTDLEPGKAYFVKASADGIIEW